MSNLTEGAPNGINHASAVSTAVPTPWSAAPAAPTAGTVTHAPSTTTTTTTSSSVTVTEEQPKAMATTQGLTSNTTDSGSNTTSTHVQPDASASAPVPTTTTTTAAATVAAETTNTSNKATADTTTAAKTTHPRAVSASTSSVPDTTKDAELAAELARQLAAEAGAGGRRPSRKRAKPEPFTPAPVASASTAHDAGSTRPTKHSRTNKDGSGKGKASGDRNESATANGKGNGGSNGSQAAAAAADTTTPAPGTHELIPGAKTVPPTGAGSGLGPDDHGSHPEDIDPDLLVKMPALLSSCVDELPKFRELALRDYTTLEKVKLITESILKVGHVAQDVIDNTEYGGHDREAVRERAKLERHLWYYISTFTREDGRKLQQLYRALAAGRVQAEAFKGRAPSDGHRRSYVEAGRERSRAPRRPRSNPNGSQMTMKGAAILVMSESDGEPMTAKQIIGEALERGLIVTQGLTPDMTLGAQLNTDIHRKGSNSQFVKMGPGLFALRHPPSRD